MTPQFHGLKIHTKSELTMHMKAAPAAKRIALLRLIVLLPSFPQLLAHSQTQPFSGDPGLLDLFLGLRHLPAIRASNCSSHDTWYDFVGAPWERIGDYS